MSNFDICVLTKMRFCLVYVVSFASWFLTKMCIHLSFLWLSVNQNVALSCLSGSICSYFSKVCPHIYKFNIQSLTKTLHCVVYVVSFAHIFLTKIWARLRMLMIDFWPKWRSALFGHTLSPPSPPSPPITPIAPCHPLSPPSISYYTQVSHSASE